MARRAYCGNNLRMMGNGSLMYQGDNADYTVPSFGVYQGDPTAYNKMLWWSDYIVQYFDTEAKVTTTMRYGRSAGIQPSDGNYQRDFAADGVIYSRRMRCMSMKMTDDYHFVHNVAYYSCCPIWKMDATGNPPGSRPGDTGVWGFSPRHPPIKYSQLAQVGKLIFVFEEQGQNQWPHDTLWGDFDYIMKNLPHNKYMQSVSMDSRVEAHSAGYLATQINADFFPFAYPSSYLTTTRW
jgi:hypothetical protein